MEYIPKNLDFCEKSTFPRPRTLDVMGTPDFGRLVTEIRHQLAQDSMLVSFGTRNTLSEQNDPKRGIGAARQCRQW